MVGRNKMKNWKAAVANWNSREGNRQQLRQGKKTLLDRLREGETFE